MKKVWVLIGILFMSCVGYANNEKIIEKFDQHANAQLKKWDIPGAAIAVVNKNNVLYKKTYGVRSLKTKAPVNEQTAFQIASLSNGFTATLTGIMVENDFLQWNDPIIKYLPNFKLYDAESTAILSIRDVLGQRTGLPEFSNDNLIESGKTIEEAIYTLNKIKLTCPVESCYAYQNVTYSMMADVLKKVTQKNYGDLLKQYIFEPLKLQNASSNYADLIATNNYAACHQLNSLGKFETCENSQFGYKQLAAGGINASLNDLIIWLRAQMGANPDIISKNILETIQTSEVNIPQAMLNKPYAPWQKERLSNATYGMGWRVDSYMGKPLMFHSGSLNGVSSALAFLPEENIGIIILFNTDKIPAPILMAQFLDLYLGIPIKDWGTPLLEKQKQDLKNLLNEN